MSWRRALNRRSRRLIVFAGETAAVCREKSFRMMIMSRELTGWTGSAADDCRKQPPTSTKRCESLKAHGSPMYHTALLTTGHSHPDILMSHLFLKWTRLTVIILTAQLFIHRWSYSFCVWMQVTISQYFLMPVVQMVSKYCLVRTCEEVQW